MERSLLRGILREMACISGVRKVLCDGSLSALRCRQILTPASLIETKVPRSKERSLGMTFF
jgi:hypothetical protein